MLWKFKLAGYLQKHFFLLIEKNSRAGKKKQTYPLLFLAYTKNFPTTCAKNMRKDMINNFKIIIYFLAMDGETVFKKPFIMRIVAQYYISLAVFK